MIREFSYSFSKDSTPVARVAVGETVSFATQDCFSGEICSESDLTDNFNYDRTNPATGPVYVEGAEPGDILVVSIKSITVGKQGVVTTLPEVGPLHDRMTLFAEIHGYQNVRVGHAALLGSGLGMARLVQFGEQFFLTGQYVL